MSRVPGYRSISNGYGWSLIVALIGQIFVCITVRGAFFAMSGRDPIAAADWLADTVFVGSFGQMFASRLIFWDRSPPALQNLVRNGITLLLSIEAVSAGTGVVLTFLASSRGATGIFLTYMAVVQAACQIGTLLWLFRYRQE